MAALEQVFHHVPRHSSTCCLPRSDPERSTNLRGMPFTKFRGTLPKIGVTCVWLTSKSISECSKVPDNKFKDFRNHVLHVRDNGWGIKRELSQRLSSVTNRLSQPCV